GAAPGRDGSRARRSLDSRTIAVLTGFSASSGGSLRYARCWRPGAMRRVRPALLLIAVLLVPRRPVGATTAADIPCDDPTPTAPCVFSGSLTVTPGSTLDLDRKSTRLNSSH